MLKQVSVFALTSTEIKRFFFLRLEILCSLIEAKQSLCVSLTMCKLGLKRLLHFGYIMIIGILEDAIKYLSYYFMVYTCITKP